jgi:hypothetical protein
MPGLELVGPIAGRPQTPSPDPVVAGMESQGLFVAGDASAMNAFSGSELGWRWLVRGQGPLGRNVQGFPPGPHGPTFGYFVDEAKARAYYQALRAHALASTPNLVPRDTRAERPLNVPNAWSESLWQHQEEVYRLVCDRMADLQVYCGNTDAIGVLESYPNGPPVVSYFSQNDVLYVAIARGPSGAAEHVVIVYSDRHQPEPLVSQGLPQSEWMKKFDQANLRFPSDILVVQWGRLGGRQTLAGEDPRNPAATLAQKLQGRAWVPLAAPPDVAPRLGGVPPGYAIRLEPGTYGLAYFELMDTPYGGFSFCAISREGAPSFMPVVVGNAGGIRHGGLSVEQYAMLSEERDAAILREGIFAPSLAEICKRYGVPVQGGTMYPTSGRIDGWELMIQGDAAFSAQWVVQRGIARMRLSGVEPTQEQIQAMAQQQAAVTTALEQNHAKHEAGKAATRRAALHVIDVAPGRSWQEVSAEVARVGQGLRPDWVLYEALVILRDPGEGGNPRFDRVDQRVTPIAMAHWHAMPQDEKGTEEPTAEKHAKAWISDIYPNNDLQVPGFFGWLSKLMD